MPDMINVSDPVGGVVLARVSPAPVEMLSTVVQVLSCIYPESTDGRRRNIIAVMVSILKKIVTESKCSLQAHGDLRWA